MFCTECGYEIEEGAKFCTNCGAPVQQVGGGAEPPAEEDQVPSAAPDRDDQGGQVAGVPAEDAAVSAEGENSADATEGAGAQEAAAADDGAPTASEAPYAAPAVAETTRMPVVEPVPVQPTTAYYAAPAPEPAPVPQRRGLRPAVIACVVAVVAVLIVGVTAGVMYATGTGPFAASAFSTPATPMGSASADAAAAGSDASQDDASDEADAAPATVSVSVPNVLGLSESDATKQLEAVGLVVGTVTEDYSSSVDAGDVISQSPAGGSAAEKGDEVTLMVSKGQKEARVEHRYTLVRRAMTWSEAQSYCEQNGGYLATITSASELSQVQAQIPSERVIMCWLGGYRSGSSWVWGTGESFSYTNWASGEPNNDGGTENRLAMLKSNGVWAWYDVPNDVSGIYDNAKMAFIMEQEVEVS